MDKEYGYNVYKKALNELFHKAIDSDTKDEVIEVDVFPYDLYNYDYDHLKNIENLCIRDGLHCETENPNFRRANGKAIYLICNRRDDNECFVLVASASVQTVLDLLERELYKKPKSSKKRGFVQVRKGKRE